MSGEWFYQWNKWGCLWQFTYCKTLDKFQTFEAESSQQLTVNKVASYFADDDIWEYKDSLFTESEWGK